MLLPIAVRPGASAFGACPWHNGADLLPVRDAFALPLPKTRVSAAYAAPLLGDSAGSQMLLAATVCAAPTLGARLAAIVRCSVILFAESQSRRCGFWVPGAAPHDAAARV